MHAKQQGQALVEMVAMVALLLLVGAALLWLQRWQQIKVQTQHHAALLAFRHAVSHELTGLKPPQYLEGLFSPLAHEWYSSVHSLANPSSWEPLNMARRDALLGGTERSRFRVQAQEQSTNKPVAWTAGRPALFGVMQVHSQTSIAVGTGAAGSAHQMVERLAHHGPLWQQSEHASQAAFKALTPLLKVVDSGWLRAEPHLNWLSPWQESIPKDIQP